MEGFWTYHRRSAPSLDKLMSIVNERENTSPEDNKWNVLNSLFSSKDLSELRQNTNSGEFVDLNVTDQDGKVIEDICYNVKPMSFETETIIHSQLNANENIVEQILDDFKTDDNLNADILENIFNSAFSLIKVFETVVPRVPDITAHNICKAFCKMNEKSIKDHSKEFYEFFLLPCVLSQESSREIESSVFDCLNNTDHIAVCSYVIVPVMLRRQPNHLLNVNFIHKLSAHQREYILKEYLFRNTEHCSWILPIILLLYKSMNCENSYIYLDLIVNYLCNNAQIHKKDLNFAKILHAVILNLNKKDTAKCDTDFWNALKQVALVNETAFKTSCLSIILKHTQSD